LIDYTEGVGVGCNYNRVILQGNIPTHRYNKATAACLFVLRNMFALAYSKFSSLRLSEKPEDGFVL